MNDSKHPFLILGLGNDILGDDAVGLLAARELKKEFPNRVEITEAAISGFEIMELLEGHEKVLILDAVVTRKNPLGSVLELSKEQFKNVVAISPHYMGLPEIFQFAERMEINFPKEVRIVAMEIEPPYEIREGLSDIAKRSLPSLLAKASDIVNKWLTGK